MAIKTTSTWLDDLDKSMSFPELPGDITTDIAIIGGGLTGMLSGYMLSKVGKDVVIIDKDSFSEGATAWTTAFLTYMIDTPLVELEKMLGKSNAKKVWESHQTAIDTIEKIVKEEKIDCEFMRCDEYEYATDKKEMESLREEEKLANSYGFNLKTLEIPQLGFKNAGALHIPRQGKFHAVKFLQALARINKKNGVKIFHHTEATKLSGEEPVLIETNQGTITARNVLIATYDPFNHPIQLFAHKGMYKSYVFEIQLAKGTIKEGLFIDQQNPYHYVRIDAGKMHDRMIVGGEDHRHEIPMDEKKNFTALEEYVKQLLPGVKYTITHKWAGPILEPSDELAYIGLFSHNPHQYVAMAFSGNGMTYAAITALMIRDYILGKKNPWEDLYNPTRIPSFTQLFQKGKDYTGEFFGGAVKNMLK